MRLASHKTAIEGPNDCSVVVLSLAVAVIDTALVDGRIREISSHHVEDHLVDSGVAGAVVLDVDVGSFHVDSRDIDCHRVVALHEIVRVLVHAEAAREALLEHVLELSSRHLGKSSINCILQALAGIPADTLADIVDLVSPVWTIE